MSELEREVERCEENLDYIANRWTDALNALGGASLFPQALRDSSKLLNDLWLETEKLEQVKRVIIGEGRSEMTSKEAYRRICKLVSLGKPPR